MGTILNTVVDIEQASFSFIPGDESTRVFQDINLTVQEKEIVVILGMSGVGKSTLLRLVCGLLAPDTGSITLQSKSSPGSRDIGFVFQEPRLFFWRRVLQNVTFGLEGLPLTRAERIERAKAVLELVGLKDSMHKWPYQLSGGQRQRVGMARALAVEPALLLMDEPLSSLDAVTNITLCRELIGIWEATHVSILYVTHNIYEAIYLADRIIVLSGSPAHIISEYTLKTPRAKRELSSETERTREAIQKDLLSNR